MLLSCEKTQRGKNGWISLMLIVLIFDSKAY